MSELRSKIGNLNVEINLILKTTIIFFIILNFSINKDHCQFFYVYF